MSRWADAEVDTDANDDTNADAEQMSRWVDELLGDWLTDLSSFWRC